MAFTTTLAPGGTSPLCGARAKTCYSHETSDGKEARNFSESRVSYHRVRESINFTLSNLVLRSSVTVIKEDTRSMSMFVHCDLMKMKHDFFSPDVVIFDKRQALATKNCGDRASVSIVGEKSESALTM